MDTEGEPEGYKYKQALAVDLQSCQFCSFSLVVVVMYLFGCLMSRYSVAIYHKVAAHLYSGRGHSAEKVFGCPTNPTKCLGCLIIYQELSERSSYTPVNWIIILLILR